MESTIKNKKLTGFFLSITLKLFAVRQYLSGGNRGPNFSGISGKGAVFFFRAISIKNCQ